MDSIILKMTSKSLNEKLVEPAELPELTPKLSKLASIVAGIDWNDF
jgi:hypothetical protein